MRPRRAARARRTQDGVASDLPELGAPGVKEQGIEVAPAPGVGRGQESAPAAREWISAVRAQIPSGKTGVKGKRDKEKREEMYNVKNNNIIKKVKKN
jgi:hypothetical protein